MNALTGGIGILPVVFFSDALTVWIGILPVILLLFLFFSTLTGWKPIPL